NGACASISSNPLGELALLARRLRHRRMAGVVFDGSGRRHTTTTEAAGLFGTLVAGDENPALRALLPAAVPSALLGDPDPLRRLGLLAEGLIPNVPTANAAATGGSGAVEEAGFDETLFATTTCEETAFPWRRGADPATRQTEAVAALHARPSGAFFP